MEIKNLRDIIINTIEEYNRYHSPEVEAKLIKIVDKKFIVEFRGTFCLTCGFYDYFDDLVYMLEDKGVKAKITNIEEIEDGGIVEYKILDEGEEAEPSRRRLPEKLVLIFD
ncbi:MAG: hypothetical protein DRJ35_00910 [Thermoprotei archaeon]|nr:MAG: hypothetical protein DRJ35_00910 [Thermoprotei archaeon]